MTRAVLLDAAPLGLLTAPPRRWILRDETWKAMANSRFNLDVDLRPGHEYIGVRVVLPFGS